MENQETIKLKAMCIFEKDGKILVSKGFDKIKNENFYRVLGGKIEFFETAEAGVRRGIEEELQSDIENLRFIELIENLFIYEGKKGHEVVFMYSGDLVKKELYNQSSISFVDYYADGPRTIEAVWVSINEIIKGEIPLYPKFDHQRLFKPI